MPALESSILQHPSGILDSIIQGKIEAGQFLSATVM